MRFNFIKTIISLAIGFLISYGFYSVEVNNNKFLLFLVSFVVISTSLTTMIGVHFERSRTTTNIRVVSIIFFVSALLINLIFSFIQFSVPTYLIINFILLLIFILILYSINNAKQ